jgi:hypothetical protein
VDFFSCLKTLADEPPVPPTSESRTTPRATCLRKLDEDVVAFDLQRKCRVFDPRIEAVPTGRHVELPPVPRTGDDRSLQSPFTQRAAGMRTNAVQRIEPPIDVEERDHAPASRQFARGPREDFAHCRHSMPIRHADHPPNEVDAETIIVALRSVESGFARLSS